MGREEGGGFRMGNTCILINFLLKKKKKKEKKEKKKIQDFEHKRDTSTKSKILS